LWSKPRNIGIPINSSYDDISFHLDKTFTKGAFVSSRGGNDDNIYTFEITSSINIKTEIEEVEEVYVREALKPTNNIENKTLSEVNADKTKVTNNQINNKTQSGETVVDNNQMYSGEVNDNLMKNESFGEKDQSIDVVENELGNNNTSDEFINNVGADTETETENTKNPGVEKNSNSNTTLAETESNQVQIKDERKKSITPSTETKINTSILAIELFNDRPMPTVFPFIQMKYLLKKGVDLKGKIFRINGVQFDKGQYIVTPEIALKLNLLIDILEENPDLEIEIAAHTSSVGDDIENLEMSKARAGSIAAHLINRGISGDRINAEGYGENRLLNKCANGVNCKEKQHNVNERIELAVF
jgi:outer membrane protein OmpA-like peptidoglycan-associated protein